MPTLKSSLIKPSKSMLFFHIWNANFSVTPINSQMYMTKPKQVQKKLSENTGKTFSVIMPPFTSRGWAYLRKLLYTKCFTSRAQRNMSGYWCQTCSYLRSSRTTTTYSPFSSLRSWPRARKLWTAAWDFSRSAYLALSSWTQQLFRCNLQALGDERSAHLWVVHPLRWREEDH